MTLSKPFSAAPLLGALLFSACALGGCDGSDSAQEAINKAGEKLEAQAVAGGNAILADGQRRKELNEVVTALNSVLNDGDPGKSGPASVLVARAKSGLGEISAKDASAVEHQFVSTAGVTQSLVDQWNSQHASAAAASRYDPSKDLAELDKSIASQTAEAAKRETDRAAQERIVTEIQARADAARSAAKRERDREAAIRKTAEGQSQTAREEIIRRAVEASRAADALDKQASELVAEAAKEQPKVAEIASDVERLRSHAEYLKGAKANIQQRADAAKQQSASAQRDADAVGKPISESVAELGKLRDAASAPSSEAQKKFEDAAKTAAKAGTSSTVKETKAAASAASGAANQSLGDLLATKARSLSVYAFTLDAVAKTKPAVPGAADAAKKADEVRAELQATRDAAKASYESAKSAYEKVNLTPEIKKKLEEIAKALEALHTPPAPPPAPAPAPEGAPADAKPADAGDAKPAAAISPEQIKTVEDEVRAALREMATASAAGDSEKVLSHIEVKNDQEKQVLLAALPITKSAKSLDAACTTKWGKDLMGLIQDSKVPAIKANPLFMMMGPLLGKGGGPGASPVMDADAVEKATIKAISPTEAEVTADGAPATTKLKKDGETWKVTGLGSMLGPMAAQMMPMLKAMNDAFTDAAAGISSGKFASADDMLTELSAKLMGAMGGMGPGGRKPPTGGGG